jgi:MtrB/PioB family decaheme-associated outer membrane protein
MAYRPFPFKYQLSLRLIWLWRAAPFIAGLSLASQVQAETPTAWDNLQPNTSSWTCSRCASAAGWELDITAGPAIVTADAYNFGDYTGLDDKGAYLFSDYLGIFRDSNSNYLFFEGYTRSEDAVALFVKGGKQGLYELRASYQAMPRRLFNSTATPYLNTDLNTLDLPTSWVRAPSTAGMADLGNSLAPINVGWDWNIWKLGFNITPGQRWQFSTDYSRRERSGVNRSAGSFYFDAAEFVTPTEYSTDDLEMALTYNAERWQTTLSYFGSVFKNDYSSQSWANPYTSAVGANTGQMALPPDNESHQLALAGSMLLPARTTLNGQLSFGHMTQNDALLPYTANPALANPLPVNSANAKVDTLNINLRAVSSPWRKITIEGELRYNEFDNKTPVNDYAYVITDVLPAAIAPANSAYDYERREFKIRGEYRLTGKTRLHAGIDTERMERDSQDRSRTNTDRLWFRMRTRLGQRSSLDLDLFTEDRGGSTYTPQSGPGAPENPLMRKYNMADRERRGMKLRGSVYAGDNSDFGWEFATGKDDYDKSLLGLTASEYVRFGIDFTYLFAASASAYASLYNEEVESEQANSQSFSAPDWTATTDDTFTTATLGATWPELIGKLDGNIEYIWSQSVGSTNNDTSGLPTTFPDLRSKRQNVKLGVSYPYSESLSFGLDYIYENFSSSDWHLDDVEPNTIPNLLALGADAWNYDTSVLYFNARYQLR